jgi:hypothetical protein
MDNTTNLSQTPVPQNPSSYFNSNSNSNSIYSSTSTSGISGFFTGIENINITTWLIIIFILAFLGFNIFVYLAKGTQDITSFFQPLVNQIFKIIASITGQTVNVSAEGAKTVVSGTANTINTGLSSVQNIAAPNSVTPNSTTTNSTTTNSNLKGQPINQKQIDIMQQTSLNRALNASQSQQQQQQQQDYQANEATSSVHGGKSGWCYVGEERGYRTCAQVGVNDTCMSGDIFPSQEICVNPSLRP